MLVEEQHHQPYSQQQRSGNLTHVKSPWNMWNIVKEEIWQWGIFLHIWHFIMNYHHNHGCNPCYQEDIAFKT